VAKLTPYRKKRWTLIALALLTVWGGFAFPESHYSEQKTFVKSQSSQTEICTILCDDVEDSNDYSTGVHIFQNAVLFQIAFPSLSFSLKNSTNQNVHQVYAKVYLLHRQLLI